MNAFFDERIKTSIIRDFFEKSINDFLFIENTMKSMTNEWKHWKNSKNCLLDWLKRSSFFFVRVLFSFFSDRVATLYVERFQSSINFVSSEVHSASSIDFFVVDELDHSFHDALDSSSHVELDSSSDVELFRHREILAHSLDADELMKDLTKEQMRDLSERQMRDLSEEQRKDLSERHDQRLNERKMRCLTHNLIQQIKHE